MPTAHFMNSWNSKSMKLSSRQFTFPEWQFAFQWRKNWGAQTPSPLVGHVLGNHPTPQDLFLSPMLLAGVGGSSGGWNMSPLLFWLMTNQYNEFEANKQEKTWSSIGTPFNNLFWVSWLSLLLILEQNKNYFWMCIYEFPGHFKPLNI